MPGALRDQSLDVALLHDYDITPAGPDPTLDSVPLLDEAVFLAGPETGGSVPEGGTGRGRRRSPGGGPAPRLDRRQPGHALPHRRHADLRDARGFVPRVRHHADDFVAVLALVAAGQGVALVPQLGAEQPPPGVRLVPLPVLRRTRLAYRGGAGAASGHRRVRAGPPPLDRAATGGGGTGR